MPFSREPQLEVVVYQGARPYARCLLHPGEYLLGQGRKNEIMVDEPSVSFRHARLTVLEQGSVYIQDAGSVNGTFVDEEFADHPILVKGGAHVQVGACQVVLREKVAFS